MSQAQAMEVLLRPAVELYTVAACVGAAFLCIAAPWSLALSPLLGIGSALAFLTFGAVRLRQAWAILRYRRNLRRLPRYVMSSRRVPTSRQRLFIGRGFRWDQRHTHRLYQTYRPEFRRYVEPTLAYRLARHWETRLQLSRLPLAPLARLTTWDHPLNPCARCHRWGACRAYTVSNPVNTMSPCHSTNASAILWCWEPPGWARPVSRNC
ncbi:hypothetical protein [Alcanivorax profundi]|uniref:hypothetical protein n=1 Tax=Alcanivorax profundi TaxID=2338368 RepID=UPI003D6C7DC9